MVVDAIGAFRNALPHNYIPYDRTYRGTLVQTYGSGGSYYREHRGSGETFDMSSAMLDAVYVDARDEKRIVAIKPKAPFKPVFQLATTREGSVVVLVHDPEGQAPNSRSASAQWAGG